MSRIMAETITVAEVDRRGRPHPHHPSGAMVGSSEGQRRRITPDATRSMYDRRLLMSAFRTVLLGSGHTDTSVILRIGSTACQGGRPV